jgi:hypothetical protein
MPSAPPKRHRHRGVLDDLLAAPDPPPTSPAYPPAAAHPAAPAPPPAAAALRFTINLPATVIERARDAVYHSPGLTLTSLAVAALTRELDRLERERGQPFPARRGPLRSGRPVG